MRIGFIDRSDASWSAGASYTRSVVNALASGLSDGDELCVLGGQEGVRELPERARPLSVDRPMPTAQDIQALVAGHQIDVLLPVTEILTNKTRCARIGWIPDFQHRRLPRYFSQAQREQRDEHFQLLLESCDAMMFSSEAVLADFRELYPGYSGPAASVHFASSLAYQPAALAADPRPVVEKFKLPRAYALVINQFWKHKNHRLVVEAVARARAVNPGVHVVMAGMLSDSRDITNAHISEIARRLTVERLFTNVSILGEVPADDLRSLLRCAAVVIQPSEFEGWSTTVEDAIALGRPLACSDIPTHREQAPGAFFFGLDDAAALADYLARFDWSAPGWDGPEIESRSLDAEKSRGAKWGAELAALCRKAVDRFLEDPEARARKKFSVDELKHHPSAYIEYLESQVARMEGVEKSLKAQVAELQGSVRDAWAATEELRLKLVESLEETRAMTQKYWRERQKPLREHVRDSLFGRRD